VRVWVGVWPPAEVLDRLEELLRPAEAALRWTRREQWHVTLEFLGEVAEDRVEPLADALQVGTAGSPSRTVALGPATVRLGRGQLVVPVAGVDDLAAAVRAATSGVLARPPEDRPSRGHLTVARSRGRQPIPRSLEGTPVAAAWTVDEVALVRSHLGQGPARYETLATAPLAP
jgi:2'-5' RNA ligase